MMGGIGGIFMVLFGIVWTIMAARTSVTMMIFGALWTAFAAVNAIYNIKNAVSKKRYSEYDITDADEEGDPFNERFRDENERFHDADGPSDGQYGGVCEGAGGAEERAGGADGAANFCPYCGTPVEDDYEFCHNCGKRLPR